MTIYPNIPFHRQDNSLPPPYPIFLRQQYINPLSRDPEIVLTQNFVKQTPCFLFSRNTFNSGKIPIPLQTYEVLRGPLQVHPPPILFVYHNKLGIRPKRPILLKMQTLGSAHVSKIVKNLCLPDIIIITTVYTIPYLRFPRFSRTSGIWGAWCKVNYYTLLYCTMTRKYSNDTTWHSR